MKNLIIYAHPNKKGNCGLILKEVTKNLKSYIVIDLYKDKYDPVLSETELYTQNPVNPDKQSIKYQKMLKNAEKIIVIFPTWWNSPPAILKGFLDKVLTPGFAFKKKGIKIESFLKGKRAAVFLTSGAPILISKVFLGQRAGKIVAKDSLQFCGIKSKFFQLGNAENSDNKKQDKISKLVNKGLRFLGD